MFWLSYWWRSYSKVRRQEASIERRRIDWQEFFFENIEDSEIFDKLINLWKFIVPAHSSHIYRPGFRLWHRLTHVLWITMDTWSVPHSSPQLSQWDTTSISPRSRHEPGGDNAEPLQVKQIPMAVGVTCLCSTPLSILPPPLSAGWNMWLRLWPITASHSPDHSIGPGKGTWPNLSQSECLPRMTHCNCQETVFPIWSRGCRKGILKLLAVMV